ncbi:MAG: methyltransferase domain-containing protein [Candidatus Acidiferrales bacterium]
MHVSGFAASPLDCVPLGRGDGSHQPHPHSNTLRCAIQAGRRGDLVDPAGNDCADRFFSDSEWRKSGVEPSRFAAARAREKGITIYQGPLGSIKLPDSAFDVITVLGVLLYLRELQRELAALRKILRPGGILLIELPLADAQLWRNSPKLSRLMRAKPRSLLGSGHLFYYNAASLTYLLGRAGLRIDKMMPVPAMKQRTTYQDLLSGVYYHASRALWALSFRRAMLGPDFLAIVSAE